MHKLAWEQRGVIWSLISPPLPSFKIKHFVVDPKSGGEGVIEGVHGTPRRFEREAFSLGALRRLGL